ncbi:MAG TPA: carboxypeptidase-like regulatory domain-containing protein [Bryobacteraceae bacterium]|jgi:hypothetical protein|nr:carboxypeptidase-like regulatory domain-containing protein [Bryobacteraceae bacterium]
MQASGRFFGVVFGFLFLAAIGVAQTPVGTIAGTVFDESGAVVPGATLTITNTSTGLTRNLTSGADGVFSAPALPAGAYEVHAVLQGFRSLVRPATVETGTTTTVDMHMQVGKTGETVTVEAATSQINYESHSVDGVITRQQIQDLPLNGRSFLQLAALQPGVSVSPESTAQYNALFSVSILGGSSSKTAINVDGTTVRNEIEGDIQQNFSQETVQEFQISSANFDLSTDITSVGSINMVTRQGGNDFHGAGYFYFRDHNMAAYPALNRNPFAPDPFFARRNPGFWVGGPILKDKLFFFFNYEYMNQQQLVTVQPDLPSVAGLAGNFSSPYHGKTIMARFDYRMNSRNNMFARYSHDGNSGFGPSGSSPTFPSNWLKNVNWADQTVFDWTSVIKPTLVNDFHFAYTYWHNRNLFPTDSDCPNCLGLGFPDIETFVGSNNFEVGNTSNATQGRDLRRYTFQDSLSWQKGTHRFRWGTELEHAPGTGFWGYCDPACVGVFSPEAIIGQIPEPYLSLFFSNMPRTIRNNNDLLNLPFADGVVGIGDPSQPPPFQFDHARANDRYRLYFQDTWKVRPNFTVNYGLAWQFESTIVNTDLPKPAYLAPVYGSDLSATRNNYKNFSPTLGFAWNVGRDSKTVIRGGAGIYWDTESLWQRLEERSYIGPLGNGRVQYPASGFTNIFPGIIDLGTGEPVPVGAPVPTGTISNLTLGQFLDIVKQEGPQVTAGLTAQAGSGITAIQQAKSASDLYPSRYPVQRSYQMSIGVQREISSDLVITADFVRRVFVNTNLGALDYNRYDRRIDGVRSPVIPVCQGDQANDPTAECSTGAITFWTPGGRSVYNGILMRASKRLSHRFQFIVSDAVTFAAGINGIQNMDDWFSSWGPQMSRNTLTISGIAELPWGFEVGLISSTASAGPMMPSISNVDLTGNGISNTPIPGPAYNCFNRGCDKDTLARAVANWNSTYAGKKDARGVTIPSLTLPAHYSLGTSFNSQDVRLTKNFNIGERFKISVFGEVFNVLNIANLQGFNFNLASGSAFGQPTRRAGQVFGSGGPRALQVGARFSF